jgi:hypothetical protein
MDTESVTRNSNFVLSFSAPPPFYHFPAILDIFILNLLFSSSFLLVFLTNLFLFCLLNLLPCPVPYNCGLEASAVEKSFKCKWTQNVSVPTSFILTFPHWEFQHYKRIQDQKSTVDRCLSPASNVFTWTCSCVFRKHAEDVLNHLLEVFKPIGSFSSCIWQILGLLSRRCHELFPCYNIYLTLRE